VFALVALPAGFLAGRRNAVEPQRVVSFETKTFEPQFISNARFMPDGRTIVFSAARNGNVPALYVSRADTTEPQPLGRERTHLLSVSSTGELAVLVDVDYIAHRLYTGTLARMTLDGAPRAWMDHVREADWAPNATDIAVVRDVEHVDHLEFPAGRSLYQTNGYISEPRVSPDGQRVAFVDHQTRFDDRGWIKVVEPSGAVTTLTGEFWGVQGLAWTPDGRALAFSGGIGTVSGYQPHIVAASPGHSAHQLLPSVGSVIVFDSAKDGRYILLRIDDRLGIRVLTPGMKEERDLGWLNGSIDPYLSNDEKLLLFTDQSEAAGRTYATAYRSVDGGPVARLGEGSGAGFSPDGRWALAVVLSEPQRLMIYPVGTGNPVQIDRGAITRNTGGAQWFPDGRRILSCGAEGSQPPRCYQQTIEGKPEPITPPGFADASLAPDGRTLLLRGTDGAWSLMRPLGGTVQPFVGLSPLDEVVGWSADSRAVYVQRPRPQSATVERLTLSSGVRETVRDIDIGDTAAKIKILVSGYRDDGSYVYWYWRRPTTLFVASGLATSP
jgi:Tol biopolymer transport system component